MPQAGLLVPSLRNRWRVLVCLVLIGCAIVFSSTRILQARGTSQQLAIPGVIVTSDGTYSPRGTLALATADGLAPFLESPGESVSYPTGAPHGPYGVAVSPDGKNVYTTDYGSDRLIVFSRDTNTGSIAVLQSVINGAGGVSGVDGSYLVTVSPDGKNVYVTGSTTDTVVSFVRSQVDGTLTFLSKLTRNDGYGFCNPGCPFALDALDGAYQVAISPDSQYGYVSSILHPLAN